MIALRAVCFSRKALLNKGKLMRAVEYHRSASQGSMGKNIYRRPRCLRDGVTPTLTWRLRFGFAGGTTVTAWPCAACSASGSLNAARGSPGSRPQSLSSRRHEPYCCARARDFSSSRSALVAMAQWLTRSRSGYGLGRRGRWRSAWLHRLLRSRSGQLAR